MLEKINEINMMCARENPIYEQISNYSIALYALDFIIAYDLMDVADIDMTEASKILRDNFEKIDASDISRSYRAEESNERYVLVLGDPQFPYHFAVVVDMNSKRPFFSKSEHVGSGLDSLEELLRGYPWEDTLDSKEIHYFRKRKCR